MIVNATLQRVDAPATTGADGVSVWTNGPALATRCAVADPTWQQLQSAEASKVSINATLYLLTIAYPLPIAAGSRVVLKPDGGDAVTYWVRTVATPTKAGGLSHQLLGLERA